MTEVHFTNLLIVVAIGLLAPLALGFFPRNGAARLVRSSRSSVSSEAIAGFGSGRLVLPLLPRTDSRRSMIELDGRCRCSSRLSRRAGASRGSPQSVLAVPQRLGGGAFPGRILVTDHRDQGGKRDDGP
jgi:hypothetical protein